MELSALHALHQKLPEPSRLNIHLQRARGYQQAIAHTLGDSLQTLNDTHSALQIILQSLTKLEDDKLIASQMRVLLKPFEQKIDEAVQALEAMV
ncbi:DUF1484 family protein [Neisseriaceae bacterium TC5R-5]|nr:DUF1484 family protein [Neisseriaceae bacterium TC5R-5]